MRLVHQNLFKLIILILNSLSVFVALYGSENWFKILLPLNENDSFPFYNFDIVTQFLQHGTLLELPSKRTFDASHSKFV